MLKMMLLHTLSYISLLIFIFNRLYFFCFYENFFAVFNGNLFNFFCFCGK